MPKFHLPETVALLCRTPAALDALLRGLPESWTRSDEGVGSWNAYDIVGHLIAGERTDWMPRVRIILDQGEARTFDPFDMLAHRKEDQSRPLDKLLDDFTHLRMASLAALESLALQPQDLALRGRHPELGPVTLQDLLATWAVHDLTHLHQLSRVMAHQYHEQVGPWSAYMGVLQCQGHSAK